VDVASPEGGKLEGDRWSDPRDESGYSADDLVSLGFINSPEHMKLITESKPLGDVQVDDYDALLAIGGQAGSVRIGSSSASARPADREADEVPVAA
jgi:hypothetical protein